MPVNKRSKNSASKCRKIGSKYSVKFSGIQHLQQIKSNVYKTSSVIHFLSGIFPVIDTIFFLSFMKSHPTHNI